jgi:hypothetical protein
MLATSNLREPGSFDGAWAKARAAPIRNAKVIVRRTGSSIYRPRKLPFTVGTGWIVGISEKGQGMTVAGRFYE